MNWSQAAVKGLRGWRPSMFSTAISAMRTLAPSVPLPLNPR